MPQLWVCERFDGQEKQTQIWPDAGVLVSGIIQEARSYLLELRGVAVPAAAKLWIDDELLEALLPPNASTARWRWNPGFYAGTIPVRLSPAPGTEHCFEVTTDPDLRKLLRTEFDVMVREILEDTHALFGLSGFRTGIAKGIGGFLPPIARLEYLRSRAEELESAVREIMASPKRVLRATERNVRHHQLRSISPNDLMRSFRTNRIERESDKPGVLPRPLKGMFPSVIKQSGRAATHDIREHRDIKAALRNWRDWLEILADFIEGTSTLKASERAPYRKWAIRARGLARELAGLVHFSFFATVGDTSGPITITELYRRVPRYATFFRIAKDLELGLSNVTGEFLNVPLSRTFELYELWAYLRLVRAAQQRFSLTTVDTRNLFTYIPQSGNLTIPSTSLEVPITKGWSLLFQRSYREFWREADGRGSFSRVMQPDIALSQDGSSQSAQLVVIDAKYRIEEQLNDAVKSIHMYRDALVQAETGGPRKLVRAAYLLTPHVATVAGDWRDQDFQFRLFHPEYRQQFRFGAVTLRPGMAFTDVQSSLAAILSDAGLDM